MRIDAYGAAWCLDKALALAGAGRLASAGGRSALARRAVRRGALAPFARRLAAVSTPAHREIAALLAAAIEAGDDEGALALVSTAGRRPDLRAEKIVSHRYRFVWICTPKAASRSLIAGLRAADPAALLIRGRTLEQVFARHPEARRFHRFAFVRHPVRRVWSFYADKHTLARRDRDNRRWFIEPWYGLRLGMSFPEFCRWLATPAGCDAFADRHWLSQSRQLRDAGDRLPDFVGSYETLEADWRTVTERLRLPPVELPRLNPRPPDTPREPALDDETAALLARRYAHDFALGGYADGPRRCGR